MSEFLCVSVRWLDTRYHGRTSEGTAPEWPPSPLRLFQAMIAGTKRGHWSDAVANAFRWLEGLSERNPPRIFAPQARPGTPYTLFVPNNDSDKPADLQRTAKIVRPTLLPDEHCVRYTWPIEPDDHGHAQRIARCTRHLTALGWGIDLAFADGAIVSDLIADKGEIVWEPVANALQSGQGMRVPITGTLARLERVHAALLDRLADGINHPAPAFNTFADVAYRRTDQSASRPYIAFFLKDVKAVDQSRLIHVAAQVRHAAIELTRLRPRLRDLAEIVSGHGDKKLPGYRQLSYVPLPSIGHRHTDPDIRRVLIAEPPGSSGEALRRLVDLLDGTRLLDEKSKHTVHRLERIDVADAVLRRYTKDARIWASFTPVILPGHDDHKPEKTRKLIQKALAQAGIDQPCEFKFSAISHFSKALSAHKYNRAKRLIGYIRPDHLLNQTAVHLTIRFENEVPGPLTIGAGRHCGFGLMAAAD